MQPMQECVWSHIKIDKKMIRRLFLVGFLLPYRRDGSTKVHTKLQTILLKLTTNTKIVKAIGLGLYVAPNYLQYAGHTILIAFESGNEVAELRSGLSCLGRVT